MRLPVYVKRENLFQIIFLSKGIEERWCLGRESFQSEPKSAVGLIEGEDERDLRELGKHLVCCIQMSNLKSTKHQLNSHTLIVFPGFARCDAHCNKNK